MLSDAELQYSYHGFHRALKRYRSTSILGWIIVLVGCLSILLGWNSGKASWFMHVILTSLTIFAGLTVVWQNISALDAYIHVPFPLPFDREPSARNEIIAEIKSLMKEVDDGGWQEAYGAIGKLNELQIKFKLPELQQ